MAGGGIYATTAVSLIALAAFVWSRRIEREIEDYPYRDVPYEPDGFRRARQWPGGGAGSKAGRADTQHDYPRTNPEPHSERGSL